jgi:phospholipid/cholesterol/gamma-HCH transport system permease protein
VTAARKIAPASRTAVNVMNSVEAFARVEQDGEHALLVAQGDWVASQIESVERDLARMSRAPRSRTVEIDLRGVERLDTSGAWLLVRERKSLQEDGVEVRISGLTEKHRQLLSAVAERVPERAPQPPSPPLPVRLLEQAGEAATGIARDVLQVTDFLGSVVMGLLRLTFRPWRFRLISVVHHLDHTALRAIPIISLISFLVGGIVAQQGAFQLRQFGAEIFTVNLVGVLTLREVGLLLTAIMIAGRSGSAFTAEIGSMKMREEIDALKVFGLDLVEVLVLPRILALILALPILTFVADIAAMAGAGIVSWIYVGIPPETFLIRLREAVTLGTFAIGLIKAPFMALIIGLIACVEGLRVAGSAESLGRHTTASVVKAIFMVIVVDGMFAVFFGAIDY